MERKQIKSQARNLMKTGSPKPLYFTMIYVVILFAFAILSFKLVGEDISEFLNEQMGSMNIVIESGEAIDAELFDEQFVLGLEEAAPSPAATLLNMIVKALTMVIGAGFIIFLLNIISGTDASYGNLFDGFGMFLRVVWLYILEGIFIFLWALLFIIPGFIAFYRYRLAIYLLLEHPEMTAMDCINESKRLMKGYKGELFVLDLSFIGWYLLVGAANWVSGTLGLVLVGVSVLGYIVQCWVLPYKGLSVALFYRKRAELDAADKAEYGTDFDF